MSADTDDTDEEPHSPHAHDWIPWRASQEIEQCVRCGVKRPADSPHGACGTGLPVAHGPPAVCIACYERVSRLACDRRDEIERLRARLAHHERGEP